MLVSAVEGSKFYTPGHVIADVTAGIRRASDHMQESLIPAKNVISKK
jgi:hypothetical protein